MKAASPALQNKINELKLRAFKAETDLSKCKSCGTCIKICPLKIREFNLDGKAITVGQCYGCNICTRKCPNNAITLYIYQINREKM